MNVVRASVLAASVLGIVALAVACSSDDGTPAPSSSSSSSSSTSSSSSSSTSSSGAMCVSGPRGTGTKVFGDSTCTADSQCAGGKCFIGGSGGGGGDGGSGGGRTFCTQPCCSPGMPDSTCPAGADGGAPYCNNQGYCKY